MGMSIDDLDFLLNDANAALEAQFRELEAARSIDGLRNNPTAQPVTPEDPLQALKEKLDSAGPAQPQTVERYVLLTCPSCKAKNRTSLEKLRRMEPKCGGCGENLAFEYPRK